MGLWSLLPFHHTLPPLTHLPPLGGGGDITQVPGVMVGMGVGALPRREAEEDSPGFLTHFRQIDHRLQHAPHLHVPEADETAGDELPGAGKASVSPHPTRRRPDLPGCSRCFPRRGHRLCKHTGNQRGPYLVIWVARSRLRGEGRNVFLGRGSEQTAPPGLP